MSDFDEPVTLPDGTVKPFGELTAEDLASMEAALRDEAAVMTAELDQLEAAGKEGDSMNMFDETTPLPVSAVIAALRAEIDELELTVRNNPEIEYVLALDTYISIQSKLDKIVDEPGSV
jgi:hypothetical protein